MDCQIKPARSCCHGDARRFESFWGQERRGKHGQTVLYDVSFSVQSHISRTLLIALFSVYTSKTGLVTRKGPSHISSFLQYCWQNRKLLKWLQIKVDSNLSVLLAGHNANNKLRDLKELCRLWMLKSTFKTNKTWKQYRGNSKPMSDKKD